jgi:hypothetical protein
MHFDYLIALELNVSMGMSFELLLEHRDFTKYVVFTLLVIVSAVLKCNFSKGLNHDALQPYFAAHNLSMNHYRNVWLFLSFAVQSF